MDSSLKNKEKSPTTSMESKIVRVCIGLSVFAHVLVFAFGSFKFWTENEKPPLEEWAIQTDVVFSGKDTATTLIKAKKGKVTAVHKKILPQVTKTEEKAQPVVPEVEEPQNKPVKVDSKGSESVPDESLTAKKEREERKKEARKKLEESLRAQSVKERKEAALRRIRDSLRKQQKFADQDTTTESKLQAKKELSGQTGKGSGNFDSSQKKYISQLTLQLRENFQIPEVYANSLKKKVTVIQFSLDRLGNVRKVKIVKGSGEERVDILLAEAAKKVTGLGRPPKGLVGRTIVINYGI